MRKKKPLPPEEKNISILSYGYDGKSIAKKEGKVLFIKYAVPGDIADIQIKKNKKTWAEGTITKIQTPSPNRTKPACAHFGWCGGCTLQMMNYEKQLEYKQQEVIEKLNRIGKVSPSHILPILPANPTLFYRNKLEYTCSNRRFLLPEELANKDISAEETTIGFHIAGYFNRVLQIKKCHLLDDAHNTIRNFIKEYCIKNNLTLFNNKNQEGFLRTIIFKTNRKKDILLYLIFFNKNKTEIEKLCTQLTEKFSEIKSLYYSTNPKFNDSIFDLEVQHVYGEKHITEQLGKYTFQLTPKSFFQTNPFQTEKLYQAIVNISKFSKEDIVLDLYCGTGTISLFISEYVQKIIGVEILAESVEDAKKHAKQNHINNVLFYCMDVSKWQKKANIMNNITPNIVIVDPPRNGLSKETLEYLNITLPQKIVYISCNPSTQARDLSFLSNTYHVHTSQAIDMFPHTHHIENIVLLIKHKS